jgi:hypothetical protein
MKIKNCRVTKVNRNLPLPRQGNEIKDLFGHVIDTVYPSEPVVVTLSISKPCGNSLWYSEVEIYASEIVEDDFDWLGIFDIAMQNKPEID